MEQVFHFSLMAIFGTSHLSDAGDLLIFNKLSHKTLLMFEKELGRDRITYLVEEALPPDAAIAAHLESTKADGILFRAETSDPIALRAAIMERIKEFFHAVGQRFSGAEADHAAP